MIITEIEFELTLPPPETPRSVGLHVSSLIRCIALETGILDKKWAEDLSLTDVRVITDEDSILRISIGLAWEEWYIRKILGPQLEVVDHPGEMVVDGIYMTQDGESISVIVTDKERMVIMVHEVKATYKSVRTVGGLAEQWMWLAQLKSYCKGAKTRFAMLHVLFLCGDYKMPITPRRRQWQIEFTQQEIDDNWDLMTGYRDQRSVEETV